MGGGGGGGQAQNFLNMEYSFYFKILKLSLNIKKCEHCKCPNYETFYINGSRMVWGGGGGGEEFFLKYGIYFEYRMQALLNLIFYVFHIDFWG